MDLEIRSTIKLLRPARRKFTSGLISALTLAGIGGCVPDEPIIAVEEAELLAPIGNRVKLWKDGVVNVCFHPMKDGKTAGPNDIYFKAAVAQIEYALRTSWQQHSSVKFDFSCKQTPERVNVRLIPGAGFGGWSDIGAGGVRNMELYYCSRGVGGNSCTISPEGTGVDPERWLRALAMHEFGHLLGFVHEHKRTDIPDHVKTWCQAATDADRAGNPGGSGFEPHGGQNLSPTYDRSSIMNYCRDTDDDHKVDKEWTHATDFLSFADQAGVRKFYPLPGDSRIRVDSAIYGSNCPRSANVTAKVAEACNGKRACRYRVSHEDLGDPSYGCAKNFVYRASCVWPDGRVFPIPAITLPPEASGRIFNTNCEF